MAVDESVAGVAGQPLRKPTTQRGWHRRRRYAPTSAAGFNGAFGSGVLARIADSRSEPGLTAEWTLRELAEGTLKLVVAARVPLW